MSQVSKRIWRPQSHSAQRLRGAGRSAIHRRRVPGTLCDEEINVNMIVSVRTADVDIS